jgi:hypothetical protein
VEELGMAIELTPQQLQLLDAEQSEFPRVVDPRNMASYVLVNEADYETVRDILRDEQQQRTIRAAALRNAIGRMNEIP